MIKKTYGLRLLFLTRILSQNFITSPAPALAKTFSSLRLRLNNTDNLALIHTDIKKLLAWTIIKTSLKGIVQRILRGVETRLIRSLLINWRPACFYF
jgi:transposase